MLDGSVINPIAQWLEVPTHFNEEWPAIPASVVAGSMAVAAAWRNFRNNTAVPVAMDYRHRSRAIEQAIVDTQKEVGSGRKVVNSAWYRLGAAACLTLSSLTAGAIFVADPTATTDTYTESGKTVVLVDDSYAMTGTTDMDKGLSRIGAVDQAIEKTTFPGKAAVMQFASNTNLEVPLQKPTKSTFDNLSVGGVDHTFAYVVNGLQNASKLFPVSSTKLHGHEQRGEIILISDGWVNDSTSAMADEAQTLKKERVGVEVIVPGTSAGPNGRPVQYTINGSQKFDSNVQPQAFISAFGGNKVETAPNLKQLENDLHHEVATAVTIPESHRSYLPFVLPGAVFLYGLRRMYKQLRKI